MRRAALALAVVAGCYVDPIVPVANEVTLAARPAPYAEMMTALCGRVEQAWDEAPAELAGFALVPATPFDGDRRAWRLTGAAPFVALRERRLHDHVVRAELELADTTPRAVCAALASPGRELLRPMPPQRCVWQDTTTTHVVEVTMRAGRVRMVCSL